MNKNEFKISNSITIHQPHFCPWIPFITRIVAAEVYVILDIVSYRHYYFQDRTKLIEKNGSESWFTIPLNGHKHFKLRNAKISSCFKHQLPKILRRFEFNYHMNEAFRTYWPEFKQILVDVANSQEPRNLIDLNIDCLRFIIRCLKFEEPLFILASELPLNSTNRTSRILEICRITGKNTLLLGGGGSCDSAVHNLHMIRNNNIEIIPFDLQNRSPNSIFDPKGISAIHWLFTLNTTLLQEYICNRISKYKRGGKVAKSYT